MIIARACIALAFLAHILALSLSGMDPSSTPISQLSRGDTGWIHTIGLLALSIAWLSLFRPLWQRSADTLWRVGCGLLLASVPVLLYVAFYFATASDAQLFGPDANDPLSVLASGLGVAMGAMHPTLRKFSRSAAQWNLLILVLWIALIPVIPFIEDGWLGAYERCVGLLMLAWTLMLTVPAGNRFQPQPET